MIVLQSLFGFAAAAIGWLTLEFVGRPLRRFFDLRGDTVELLTRIGNVGLEAESDIRANARKETRALASKFRSFALNETLASKISMWLGYNAYAAAQALIGVSNTIETKDGERHVHKSALAKALKFKPIDL
jgi:hypothetical protein